MGDHGNNAHRSDLLINNDVLGKNSINIGKIEKHTATNIDNAIPSLFKGVISLSEG